jgi:hypothetical protein
MVQLKTSLNNDEPPKTWSPCAPPSRFQSLTTPLPARDPMRIDPKAFFAQGLFETTVDVPRVLTCF